jgi:NAD+ synthase
MPNGLQGDISDSREVCQYLGTNSLEINMEEAYDGLVDNIAIALDNNSKRLKNVFWTVRGNNMIRTNLPARLRMATLYAVAALYPNSRVVNTCNLSEDYVGYSTKYGDAAGDFSPLGNLTVREVLEIGDELGLPEHLVHKAPSDGMCGKTDEDNLGFTYEQLDDHILGTAAVDEEVVEKIERLHKATRHKYQPMPTFYPLRLDVYSEQLTIDDYAGDNSPFATGGLVNDINISGNTNSFTIAPLHQSTPSYDNVNLQVLADNIQKVIDSAGCGLLRRNQ